MKGLGDTIHKVAEVTGVKAVVETVSEKTGKPCGCKERRERLNKKYPYKWPIRNYKHQEQKS
jgi:hypothetical protein